MRKIIAAATAALVLGTASLLPGIPSDRGQLITASAEEMSDQGYYYSVLEDGTAEITGCSVTDANVTVPAKLGGRTVSAVGIYAFVGCGAVSMTLPEGIKRIDPYAFALCSSLKSLTLPASLETVDGTAFQDCFALTSINVTSGGSFSSHDGMLCGSAGRLLICCPAGKTSAAIPDTVTEIGTEAFDNCKYLTSLVMPDSIRKIGSYAFSGCIGLTSVTLSKNTESIGSYAFLCCPALSEIKYSDSISFIGTQSFCDTPWLERKRSEAVPVIVSGIVVDGSRCSGSVTLPQGTTMIAGRAFENNKNITSVTLPAGVKCVSEYAFSGCTSLSAVLLPDGLGTVEQMAFDNCTSLKAVTLPRSVSSIGDLAFGYSGEAPADDNYKVPGFTMTVCKGGAGERYAADNGFTCILLEADFIPGDVDSSGTVDMVDYALLQRKLSNWNVSVNEAAADLNADGNVDMVDYALLQRKLSGWDITA